ncbi:SDR family NAD(P)-dependent oxidoreductase [Paenibacillus flagellatus]|nr:SDR family NAD(P)-dependent oxidoreductase [Paenibacillus flagellatus]
MKLFIVTGASRGLGEAIVRRLMRPGHRLVGIARGETEGLAQEARAAGAELDWIRCDLSDAGGLEAAMERACSGFGAAKPDTACLINNAGTVHPMGPAAGADGEELARNIAVNLIAPAVLTAAFLRRTGGWGADLRVLNVSSGAGRKPYAGWSGYCASKAGLDMFTRCVAAEHDGQTGGGVRIVSVAPGVVDTDMQRDIRETSAERFRDRDRFVRLKQAGELTAADEAAAKLLDVLFDDRYPSGSVLDLRDLPFS